MTNVLITDAAQIADFWNAMEVEDAARQAKALPVRAGEQAHDLTTQLQGIRLLMELIAPPDVSAQVNRYLELAEQRAAALAQTAAESADVLTHAAVLVMALMKQRNAKTAELAGLIEALETGDESHPRLQEFAARLDERRMDYSHLETSLGDDAAGVIADLFLGRGGIEADALETLVNALLAEWEAKTGKRVALVIAESKTP